MKNEITGFTSGPRRQWITEHHNDLAVERQPDVLMLIRAWDFGTNEKRFPEPDSQGGFF